MSREITYTAKVAWGGRNAGGLVLGSGKIGTDKISGSNFSAAYTGTYDDVSADVKTYKITRGRDTNLENMREGSLELTLWDRAGTIPGGKYNPNNTASPLYGSLRPARPVIFKGTVGGTTYGMFQGWSVDGADNYDWATQTATLHFIDLYTWLDGDDGPVIPSTGPTTTGAAIKLILSYIGWVDPTLMALDVGDTIPDFSADGQKSALQLINDLLTAERGVFFFSGNGIATYYSRNKFAAKSVADVNLTLANLILPGFDLQRIKNRYRVLRTGGVLQEYIDVASKTEFGVRGKDEITTPYLQSDAQALLLANYMTNLTKDPNNPIWGVDMMEDSVSTAIQIGTELGAWVTVTGLAGITGNYQLERIELKGGGGLLHTTTWGLSQRPSTIPGAIGFGKIGTMAIGF